MLTTAVASTERFATRAINTAVKPWPGRNPLAMRPVGPSNSTVPASPASPPLMRKLESPRVQRRVP